MRQAEIKYKTEAEMATNYENSLYHIDLTTPSRYFNYDADDDIDMTKWEPERMKCIT